MKKGRGEEEKEIGERGRTAEDGKRMRNTGGDGRRRGGKIEEGEEDMGDYKSGPPFKVYFVSKA